MRKKVKLPPLPEAEARERAETLRTYMAGIDRPTGSLGLTRREAKRGRRRPMPPGPPEPESPKVRP